MCILSTSDVSDIAACTLSPVAEDVILQLYHLPPPLLPPVSNSSFRSLNASCCIVLLYISKYYTYKIKNVSFIFCVSFLYLYEKYCKPITVPYYMAGFVSWVPRLALEKKKYIQRMTFSLVQFSRSVVSDSLGPHESQHARPPCPSPTSEVHPDSCPSSQ